MPDRLAEVAAAIDRIADEARQAGRREAEQTFYGGAAVSVLLGVFAAAAEDAAARIAPYDPRVAAFLHQAAEQYREAGELSRVTATDPGSDETGVPLDASVFATFERRIEPASLTAETFRVAAASGGSPLEATVSWDEPNLRAILTPTNGFSAGVAYRATLEGVRNRGGMSMPTYSWTFEAEVPPE